MANNLGVMPLSIDTDLANFGTSQTLQATPFGLRVWKFALVANATTVAGTVTVTDPASGVPLIPPMVVSAGATAGTTLYYDNPTQLLTWKNFAVTGTTATSTRLFVWYRV